MLVFLEGTLFAGPVSKQKSVGAKGISTHSQAKSQLLLAAQAGLQFPGASNLRAHVWRLAFLGFFCFFFWGGAVRHRVSLTHVKRDPYFSCDPNSIPWMNSLLQAQIPDWRS